MTSDAFHAAVAVGSSLLSQDSVSFNRSIDSSLLLCVRKEGKEEQMSVSRLFTFPPLPFRIVCQDGAGETEE